MAIVLDGTNGINTPDLESAGPVSGTTGTFSGAVRASGVATDIYPLVSATAVTASGTSVDFTGIPSWVKRITVMFSGVSTNGTSPPQIQIGSGSVSNTGYACSNSVIANASAITVLFTNGFGIGVNTGNWSSASTVSGVFVIDLVGSNIWCCSGSVGTTNAAATFFTNGSITLGGSLDRVRIPTVNGTDTFDAGTINIMYE